MNAEQLQQEVGRALAIGRLKEHQRRSVAAVVIMAKCSVEEALRSIDSWRDHKPDWNRAWCDGSPLGTGCTGYIEQYAAHTAFENKKLGKLPVTSLADFRRAKERQENV